MESTEAGYESTPLEDLVSTNVGTDGQELADLMQDELSEATRRSTETDATLHSRCLENMTAEDAQQLLYRRASLVAAGLMRETPCIEVDLDESSGMHFLMHELKAKETPLFNLCGPSSGTLHPGDESTSPGVALLKTTASKNTKADKDPAVTARWTDEHAHYSITSWR